MLALLEPLPAGIPIFLELSFCRLKHPCRFEWEQRCRRLRFQQGMGSHQPFDLAPARPGAAFRRVVNPQIAALSTRNHRKFLYLKAFS